MARLTVIILFTSFLTACAAAPSEADREACIAAGHRIDTAGFDACLQELRQRRFDRRPGATVDEMRQRL